MLKLGMRHPGPPLGGFIEYHSQRIARPCILSSLQPITGGPGYSHAQAQVQDDGNALTLGRVDDLLVQGEFWCIVCKKT